VTERPFDPGLQVERTTLAWRRTVLALAAASLAGVKVLLPVGAVGAFAVGGGGLAVALIIGGVVIRRHRRTHHALTRGDRRLPDARPLAMSAALTLTLGLTALLFVLATT
jgi:putative membrane protein